MSNNKAGWSGYWSEFINLNKEKFIDTLTQYVHELPWTKDVSKEQILAWEHEFDAMRSTLNAVLENIETNCATKAWISFEHELTGESGKRAADVNLVLPSGELIVIEFKHKNEASQEEITRAQFDLQTLLRFHSESMKLEGRVYLVFSQKNAQPFVDQHVICDVINQNILPKLTADLIQSLQKPMKYDVSEWQNGTFLRQPSILAGTIDIFFKEQLPQLKTEAAHNINEARATLVNLYEKARQQNKRYVVMVHGRPGAGKTLLGMSVVAELARKYQHDELMPLFISGNGPLVQVLRYTINYYKNHYSQSTVDARSMIEDLIHFKKTFKSNQRQNNLGENYIFFDEAQRAWDDIGVYQNEVETELHLLFRWLHAKTYGVLVLLIGDGQAIHNREMNTRIFMQQVNTALGKYGQDIEVIIPELYKNELTTVKPAINHVFNLKNPIRQHFTEDLDRWIEAVLHGDHVYANSLAKNITDYPLLLTRDKNAAENYSRNLYQSLHHENVKTSSFRFGWLESSKGKRFLPRLGKKYIGQWFVESPEHPKSCCACCNSATEFEIQGLEISIAMLNWGADFLYRNGKLDPTFSGRQINEYTFGAYRVLLSRGKMGLIIKVDDDETFNYLLRCGMNQIYI